MFKLPDLSNLISQAAPSAIARPGFQHKKAEPAPLLRIPLRFIVRSGGETGS